MSVYSTFFGDIYSSLSVFFLLLTILARFFVTDVKILSASFLFYLLFAFLGKRIDILGLFFITLFFLNFYFFQKVKKLLFKYFLGFSFLIFCLLLGLHKVPGFYNWEFARNLEIKSDSILYSMFLNFDKPLVGLIPLLIYFQPMGTLQKWKKMFISLFPILVLISFILPIFASIIDYIKFDFGFHATFGIWAVRNLLLTCVAEEFLFRGFLQKKLEVFFLKWDKAYLGIVVVAVLFGLAHFSGGISYVILAFTAGLFYGYAYYKTKRLEASILIHFYLNCIHFIFFSYPALV